MNDDYQKCIFQLHLDGFFEQKYLQFLKDKFGKCRLSSERKLSIVCYESWQKLLKYIEINSNQSEKNVMISFKICLRVLLIFRLTLFMFYKQRL